MTTKDDRWSVALVAGGLWLLIDVQRVWTPSLITIFGQAAETPPELIGAFALACAAAPLLLLLVLPRSGTTGDVALGLLVITRVAIAFTDGGRPQLVMASVGTVAGLWWLALVCGRRAQVLVPGLAWGLLLATTAHAALGTYGAVWRRDAGGVIELAVVVGLVVAAMVLTRGSSYAVTAPGRRAAWLVLPVLLLCGVLFTNAGRASSMAGMTGVLASVAGCLLAVGLSGRRPTRRVTVLATATLVAVTALGALLPVTYDGITTTLPWLQALVFLLGAPAALLLLSASISPTPEERGGPLVVAGGSVLWVVLLFVYYAGYDLGYRADVVLVALAVVVAITAATGGRATEMPPHQPSLRLVAVVAVVTLVLASLGPWLSLRPFLDDRRPVVDELRVVSYNLRMGYGTDGRFDQMAVAELLAGQYPDVILLSEIDRGWLLNGGQDQLRILARLLDMHAAFGPAADQVWGDAILTRTPLRDVESHPLERDGAVTGAQALTAKFTWQGRDVTVISTHLQPGSGGTDDTVVQSTELAELMTAAQRGGAIVVAGGDLNLTPGSDAWAELTATGFEDSLAAARPLYTARSEDPDEEIDHLFVTPGVVAQNPRVVATLLSDHLPVLVNLTLPPA